ncbi:sugar ABC transporter ATP-binding protein [Martelella mediterranea]|uniref:sugar ABC transporter ATP-binding protein n=1 Tax=Martelella mediterranea TaxID=293089 RepID=UPI001E2C63CB|nr:sugar ABC transporter ATP-binding protein [Martelella mediterranea]MCD1635800.1 sugar ABC transporter ATP-binding protein [Martelella mediterranea]
MLLSTENLTKQYPGVLAVDNFSFSIEKGEVRALMGRNGAGKSTFIKMVSGLEAPTSGTIRLNGEVVTLNSPNDALDAGIATVHQELNHVHGLTVAENIMLGHWRSRAGFINYSEVYEKAQAALDILGERIPLHKSMGELSIAELQICEIAHAIAYHPRLLILDEPTSSLPQDEVERVLNVVRKLSDEGVAVLYVSHRMDEIARVADSVTVIRDGRAVETNRFADTSISRIAAQMIGGKDEEAEQFDIGKPGDEIALRVTHLAAGPKVRDVSFDLRRGEVLGIAGLLGAGRTELLQALAGIAPMQAGGSELFGEGISGRNVRELIRKGLCLVPENRKAEGIILDLPIRQNLVLSCLSKVSRAIGWLDRAGEKSISEASRQQLDIKLASLSDPVASLSGGNQQKVVLGRCLNSGVKVLLLDEPTRGVDVHAKQQIYREIAALASRGMAILLVSSEYEELMLLCHRIMILEHGRNTGAVDPRECRFDDLLEKILRVDEAPMEQAT